MSYLHLPSLSIDDIQTGTISIWFRFSNDTVQNAREHNANYRPPDFGGPSIFAATIPLVTFGRKVMANNYDTVPHYWSLPTGEIGATTIDWVPAPDSPAEPSHLGLVVDPVRGGLIDEGVFPRLYFQTATRAQVQGLVTQATSVTFEIPPGGHALQRYDVVKDISFVRTGTPEAFEIIPHFKVDVDKWHHLLVSFDFSGSVNVTPHIGTSASEEQLLFATVKSFCKVWYAFDDENKAGKDNIGDSWVPHDPNGIVPVTAKQAAYDYFPSSPPVDSAGRPTVTGELYDGNYSWTASPVPMSGGPVGLPASVDYVDTIYHCEQAEFQFFAGLAIDTEDQQKRRAFVDAKGKPIKPEDTEKALGRRPDILLHGSSNWKQGKNTGTTGLTKNDKGEEVVIQAGQFQHIGLIKTYTPDPALSETETA